MPYRFLRRRHGRRRRLGDSGWVDAITGQPVTDIAWSVPTDLPPAWNLPGSGIPSTPFPSGILTFPTPLPNVTGSTLLQAAKLPGSPAVVKQAAAQYASQNPVSTWLSEQTIAGIPNMYLLGGAGLAVILLASAGGKGRR